MHPPGIDADEIWKIAWTYIQTVVDTVREPFLILDENLEVISANRTFTRFFRPRKKILRVNESTNLEMDNGIKQS